MKIEDIIESLNRYIEEASKGKAVGHVVLHKVISPNPAFKAYKEVAFTLYLIIGRNRYPLIKVSNTFKIVGDIDDTALRPINIEFMKTLFEWSGSEDYKKIINGTYTQES